jgi:hypothetical protein
MTGDGTGVSDMNPAFMAAVRQEMMGQGPEAQPEIAQPQAAPEAPQNSSTEALMSGAADASRVAAMAHGGAVKGYAGGGGLLGLQKYIDLAKEYTGNEDEVTNSRDNKNAFIKGGLATLIASSKPGADFFGSVGEGGLAGLNEIERRKAERSKNKMSQLTTGLSLQSALAKQNENVKARPGEVILERQPDGTLVPVYTAPSLNKDTALEAKIKLIQDANPDLSPDQVINIATGVTGIDRDPVTGAAKIYNLADLSGKGGPKAPASLSPTTGQGVVGPPQADVNKPPVKAANIPLLEAVNYLGGSDPLKQMAASATIGAYDPGQTLNIARDKLKSFSQDVYAMRGGLSRLSENERSEIKKLLPSMGVFVSPAAEYDKLITWKEDAEKTIKEQTAIRNDDNAPADQRKEAASKISSAKSILTKIGDPEKIKRPSDDDTVGQKAAEKSNLNLPSPSSEEIKAKGWQQAPDGNWYKKDGSGQYSKWVP